MTHDDSKSLPTHALDVQLDLLRYYTRDERGRRYADSIFRDNVYRVWKRRDR